MTESSITDPQTPESRASAPLDLTGMFDGLARDGAASFVDQCSPDERRALFDALVPWIRDDPERAGLFADATGATDDGADGASTTSPPPADGRVDIATMMQSPEVVAQKVAASQAQRDATIAKDAMVDRVTAEQRQAGIDSAIERGIALALGAAGALVPGAAGAEKQAAAAALAILPTLRGVIEVIPVKESDRGLLRRGVKILHETATPINNAPGAGQ